MDKNQVIDILTTKGFRAHDTNGILYVDLEDIAPASIEKIRTMLKELHYYNSWGVKKVLVGVQPPSNVKVIDSSAQNNTIEDEESDDNNDIYPETKEVLDNTVLDNRYRSEDEMGTKNEISTEDEDQDPDLDDDMTFDENSPFEQVSLFDIMR